MQTFQASVRVHVDGRSQIVQTQIRTPNSNDARWLLWAQFDFHSIRQVKCFFTLVSIICGSITTIITTERLFPILSRSFVI